MMAAQAAGSRRRVVVLGSTGSIGTSCLKVIDHLPDRLQAWGLSGHSRWQDLHQQTFYHEPLYVQVSDSQAASAFARQTIPAGTEVLEGEDAIGKMVSDPE